VLAPIFIENGTIEPPLFASKIRHEAN
jgi:hypothetical protein